MIGLFWFFFLGAGVVMRTLTPSFHFRNKTITQYLSRKTQKNIHHLHIGLLFAIVSILIIMLNGLNKPLLFFAAMGLSFIADEVFIVKDFSKYFTKKGLALSVLGHLLIGGFMTITLMLLY